LGIGLLSGLFVGGAMLSCAVLMAVFTFVQASVLWRGLAISCGCFSTSDQGVISYATLIRTIVLLIVAIVGFLLFLYFRTEAIVQAEQPVISEGIDRKK